MNIHGTEPGTENQESGIETVSLYFLARYTGLLCLLAVLFFLTISSCTSYRYIDIQVLNPSSIDLPKLNTLVLVDYLGDKKASSDKKTSPLYDTIISQFQASIKKALEESPAFNHSTIDIISADSIRMLANERKDTDQKQAILKFKFQMLIDTSHAGLSILRYPYGFYTIYNKYQFQLVDLNTNNQYDWYQSSNSFHLCRSSLTDDGVEGIKELARETADSYAKRIAPYWSTEERMLYYTSNGMMRKAYTCFCENDLDGAMMTWKELSEIGTSRLASLAAHNVALVYELLDDVDSCETWLVKSIQFKLNHQTNNYLTIIRSRKLSRVFLEKQLL
jgi:hypothetical protein